MSVGVMTAVLQMSTMKSSLSEMGSKLVASHSQHCEAAAKSEATICGLKEKYCKASGELAVLRSAVEAAALEQERAEGQMKRLQQTWSPNRRFCKRCTYTAFIQLW